ncbi:MAG: Crp/Fnr family transcriptional regulator [Synechococcaceae cyanobacterium]|jgi:CRP-like cAMP-binding protein|nr:Crp/Fnr family transcriptional regulator [Synechococcaceae cyanobacterium]
MAPPERATDLDALPLFAELAGESRRALLDRHLAVRFEAEQTLVMEGDWGESVFLLRRGIAKVRSFSGDGEEVILSLLGGGELFGELAILDENPRSADVVALTPVELVKLRAAPFREVIRREPSLALALARLQAGRLRDLNRRFAIQTSDATTRLLAALAYLAAKAGPEGDPQAAIPPLPQRELAVLSGLARETASRTLSKLRQRGTVVDTPEGGLRLADLKPLKQRALLG